jgi:hypothetical protein
MTNPTVPLGKISRPNNSILSEHFFVQAPFDEFGVVDLLLTIPDPINTLIAQWFQVPVKLDLGVVLLRLFNLVKVL